MAAKQSDQNILICRFLGFQDQPDKLPAILVNTPANGGVNTAVYDPKKHRLDDQEVVEILGRGMRGDGGDDLANFISVMTTVRLPIDRLIIIATYRCDDDIFLSWLYLMLRLDDVIVAEDFRDWRGVQVAGDA